MAGSIGDVLEAFASEHASGEVSRRTARRLGEAWLAGSEAEAFRAFRGSRPEAWSALVEAFLGPGRGGREREARAERVRRLLDHPAAGPAEAAVAYRVVRRSPGGDPALAFLRERLGSGALAAVLADLDGGPPDRGDVREAAALLAGDAAVVPAGAALGTEAALAIWRAVAPAEAREKLLASLGERVALALAGRLAGGDVSRPVLTQAADLLDRSGSPAVWRAVDAMPDAPFFRLWEVYVKPASTRRRRIRIAAESLGERGLARAIESTSRRSRPARDLEILRAALGEEAPLEAARVGDRDDVRLALRLLARAGGKGLGRLRQALASLPRAPRRAGPGLHWTAFLFDEMEETGLVPGFPAALLDPAVEDGLVRWVVENLVRRGNDRRLREFLLDLRRVAGSRGVALFFEHAGSYRDLPRVLEPLLEDRAPAAVVAAPTRAPGDATGALLALVEDLARLAGHLGAIDGEAATRTSLLSRRMNRRLRELLEAEGLTAPPDPAPGSVVPFDPHLHRAIDGAEIATGEQVLLLSPPYLDSTGSIRQPAWVRRSAQPGA